MFTHGTEIFMFVIDRRHANFQEIFWILLSFTILALKLQMYTLVIARFLIPLNHFSYPTTHKLVSSNSNVNYQITRAYKLIESILCCWQLPYKHKILKLYKQIPTFFISLGVCCFSFEGYFEWFIRYLLILT